MNTVKNNIFLASLLLATIVGFANNKNFTYKTIDSKKVTVEFKDVKKGHLLSIIDKHGVKIYSEVVSENGDLSKIIDMSSLEKGTYYVELEKDFKIIIKPFEVKKHQVFIDKMAEKVIFKPVIRSEENLLLISKLAFEEEYIQLTLYYENEIIYSETIKGENILNRVYRLESEEKGNYLVSIYSNGRNFRNAFKI